MSWNYQWMARLHEVFSHAKFKNGCSLIDVRLLTGRKYQIRQHLSALGYPIIGDRLYGDDACKNDARDLQQQSVSLQFLCPISDTEQHFPVTEEQRLQLPAD